MRFTFSSSIACLRLSAFISWLLSLPTFLPTWALPLCTTRPLTEAMPKLWGQGRRGSIGRPVQRASRVNWVIEDGYGTGVSIPIRRMIDCWEARLIQDHLASGRGDGNLNHYSLVKNMLGVLMEKMAEHWASARQATRTMKDTLANLDAGSTWQAFVPHPQASINIIMAGSANAAGDSKATHDVDAASFPTPSTIGVMHPTRLRSDTGGPSNFSRKKDPLPVKHPSLDSSDDDYAGYRILEEPAPDGDDRASS